MSAYLRSPLSAVWLLLTLVTFVSWWLGAGGDVQHASARVTAGVVAIALAKIQLVFWYFMDVRSAPAWLRWSCSGWLAVLGAVLWLLR